VERAAQRTAPRAFGAAASTLHTRHDKRTSGAGRFVRRARPAAATRTTTHLGQKMWQLLPLSSLSGAPPARAGDDHRPPTRRGSRLPAGPRQDGNVLVNHFLQLEESSSHDFFIFHVFSRQSAARRRARAPSFLRRANASCCVADGISASRRRSGAMAAAPFRCAPRLAAEGSRKQGEEGGAARELPRRRPAGRREQASAPCSRRPAPRPHARLPTVPVCRPWRVSPGLLAMALASLAGFAAPSAERAGAALNSPSVCCRGDAPLAFACSSGGGRCVGAQIRKSVRPSGLHALPLAPRWRMLRQGGERAVVAMSRRGEDETRAAMERLRMHGGLPQHLGIVMDGNRRYAKSQTRPTGWGHLKGKERLEQTIRWVLMDLQIPCLTVYALSLDNLSKRSPGEVEQLCDLIALGLDELRCSADIKEHGIRVKIAGAVEALPERLRKSVQAVEDETRDRGSGGLLTLCIGYGGREDLVEAARRMARDVAEGVLQETDITEKAISERLWTAGLPDADLVIRTSGEERISNFLLWHIAYSELFFSPLPWPAFDAEALIDALGHYSHRNRRFGQ